MKKVVKRIVNIIIDIIVILILAVSVLIVTLSLTSKSSGVPNIFGVAPLSVLSSSMEDTINIGDMILCEVTDDPSYEYEKGDIVTFPITVNGESVLNTHRIVEVVKDDNITYYRTQGDNKKTNPEPDEELQTSSSIVAKYTGTKIGGVGNFLSFIRTQLGFFLCVLLPMIIFFVYEAIRVVLNLLAYNKEKTLEEAKLAVDSAELTEEQKKRAIEEYLASVGENQDKAENEPEVQTPADGNNSADNSD
ncbi:MAG: signal peptidase I [Ruminococcus sp.]